MKAITSKDTYYSLDRSDMCFVYKNATDMPIQLMMHHFHKRVLIVNTETGDICSQLFVADRDGRDSYFDSSLSVLAHDCFFADKGPKVYFTFVTDYTGMEVSIKKYTEYLDSLGVVRGADIKVEMARYPHYAQYRYGEIPVFFGIDLKNAKTITSWFPDYEQYKQAVNQKVFSEVGSRPSTIPDINELERTMFDYCAAFNAVMWSNPDTLKELVVKGLDLLKYPAPDTMVGKAIAMRNKYERGFSHYAYKNEENTSKMMETFYYAYEHRFPTYLLIDILNMAAEGFERNVLYSADMDPLPEFLEKLGMWLYNFAILICKERAKNKEQMKDYVDDLGRVSRMMHEMNNYEGSRHPLRDHFFPIPKIKYFGIKNRNTVKRFFDKVNTI